MENNTITISRKNFIKVSALSGIGMLFGVSFLQSCNPKAKMPADLESLNYNDFNAYIQISNNGMVTIYSPNPEIGQGVKTSMPMILADELDVPWEHVRVVQANLDTTKYKRQIAGGSDSIRTSWKRLREAGATARQMLITAAANQWKINSNDCSTSNGFVLNGKGDKLNYGELVIQAAKLEVPKKINLKKVEDFKIIGTKVKNVDNFKITQGDSLYGMDYYEEGMVYAAMIHPPAFGQKLIDFDAFEAKKIQGVTDVIRFENNIAVIANSTWVAFQGKKAIKANYEEADVKEDSAYFDELMNEAFVSGKFKKIRKDGNVNKAFKEADVVVERKYEAPFLPHNTMEPMNFYANVTADKIDLKGPIQMPGPIVKNLAKTLNREVKDISVELCRIGGGFGRRLKGDYVINAATISNIIKKPVKLVYTREDDMTVGFYRPKVKYKIKAAIKNGHITGYHLQDVSINSNVNKVRANFFPSGSVPNLLIEGYKLKSKVTISPWRAPICNILAFAEQSFFDELAGELNQDPVAMRLNLLKEAKKNKDKNMRYSPERMEDVIRKVTKDANWGVVKKGVYQGFSAYYSHNTHVAQIAEVIIKNNKPVVTKVYCAVDCGIVVNPLGAAAQAEGGILDGIGHAMFGEQIIEKGVPKNSNFHQYHLGRLKDAPEIEVSFIQNSKSPTGMGEPTFPPAAAAVANAIKAAVGIRLRAQPFVKNGLI